MHSTLDELNLKRKNSESETDEELSALNLPLDDSWSDTTDSEMSTPTALDDGKAFTIEKADKPMSARLNINLLPYITAHLENKAFIKMGGAEHLKNPLEAELLKTLENEVTGLSGSLMSQDIINCAMKDVDEVTRNKIKDSPGIIFVGNYLIEGIKNTMGEAITGYFDSVNPRRGAEIQFELTVADIQHDSIELILADNGRGFPADFLAKMASSEGRDAYLKSGGSTRIKNDEGLQLFGGAGRAIRMLLANIDHQAELESVTKMTAKYKKPDISDITFSNALEGGAVITIKTSLKKLERLVSPEQMHDVEVQMTLSKRFGKKNQAKSSQIVDEFNQMKLDVQSIQQDQQVKSTQQTDEGLKENISPNVDNVFKQ